jgi:hypothetical protein
MTTATSPLQPGTGMVAGATTLVPSSSGLGGRR